MSAAEAGELKFLAIAQLMTLWLSMILGGEQNLHTKPRLLTNFWFDTVSHDQILHVLVLMLPWKPFAYWYHTTSHSEPNIQSQDAIFTAASLILDKVVGVNHFTHITL